MKAILKSIHSATFEMHYEEIQPQEIFSFDISVELGANELQGSEIFNFWAISPKFLYQHFYQQRNTTAVLAKDLIIAPQCDFDSIIAFLSECINSMPEASTWEVLAKRFGKWGTWEFEDYVEFNKQLPKKECKAVLKNVFIDNKLTIPLQSDIFEQTKSFPIFVQVNSLEMPQIEVILKMKIILFRDLLFEKQPIFGRGNIVVFQNDTKQVYLLLANYINSLREISWEDVVYKLERIGEIVK